MAISFDQLISAPVLDVVALSELGYSVSYLPAAGPEDLAKIHGASSVWAGAKYQEEVAPSSYQEEKEAEAYVADACAGLISYVGSESDVWDEAQAAAESSWAEAFDEVVFDAVSA